MNVELKPISDYKCCEFHVTPVFTLAWSKESHVNIKWGFGFAFEWGFWALMILVYKPKEQL